MKYHYSPSEAAIFADPLVMSPTVAKVQANKENACVAQPATGHAKKGSALTPPFIAGVSTTAPQPNSAADEENSDFYAGKDALLGNIPNPFKNTTTVIYSLYNPESSGEIRITDILGRTLAVYHVTGMQSSVTIDCSGLAPGIYYYTLYVNGVFDETKKMAVIR